MKRKSVLLLLPLLCLASCNDRVEYPFTDDGNLIYLTRNGDNYGSTSNTLSSFPRLSSGSELVSRISSGESIFVYAYQYGCAACSFVEDAMTAFLRDSGLTCYGLYDDVETRQTDKSVIKAAFDTLKTNFSSFAEVIGDEYRTPTAYLIKNSSTIVNLTFSGEKEDPYAFELRMKDLANYTCIYEFKQAQTFLDFAASNDCFYVFDDKVTSSGAFMSKVYEKAIHSPKKTARISYSSLSSEDKALLSSRFGNGSGTLYGQVNQGKFEIQNYKDNDATFEAAIDAYYLGE